MRVRPFTCAEAQRSGRKDILRVLDKRLVVVLDPDDDKVLNSVVLRGKFVLSCLPLKAKAMPPALVLCCTYLWSFYSKQDLVVVSTLSITWFN